MLGAAKLALVHRLLEIMANLFSSTLQDRQKQIRRPAMATRRPASGRQLCVTTVCCNYEGVRNVPASCLTTNHLKASCVGMTSQIDDMEFLKKSRILFQRQIHCAPLHYIVVQLRSTATEKQEMGDTCPVKSQEPHQRIISVRCPL